MVIEGRLGCCSKLRRDLDKKIIECQKMLEYWCGHFGWDWRNWEPLRNIKQNKLAQFYNFKERRRRIFTSIKFATNFEWMTTRIFASIKRRFVSPFPNALDTASSPKMYWKDTVFWLGLRDWHWRLELDPNLKWKKQRSRAIFGKVMEWKMTRRT